MNLVIVSYILCAQQIFLDIAASPAAQINASSCIVSRIRAQKWGILKCFKLPSSVNDHYKYREIYISIIYEIKIALPIIVPEKMNWIKVCVEICSTTRNIFFCAETTGKVEVPALHRLPDGVEYHYKRFDENPTLFRNSCSPLMWEYAYYRGKVPLPSQPSKKSPD